MPDRWVKSAAGEDVKGGACENAHISDHEAWMVCRETIMNGCRENAITAVEKEYENGSNYGEGPKLHNRSNLMKPSYQFDYIQL